MYLYASVCQSVGTVLTDATEVISDSMLSTCFSNTAKVIDATVPRNNFFSTTAYKTISQPFVRKTYLYINGEKNKVKAYANTCTEIVVRYNRYY